jgi:hypothetical protein
MLPKRNLEALWGSSGPENQRPSVLFWRQTGVARAVGVWHGACMSSPRRVSTTKDEVSMKLLLAVNAVSENHRRIALLALLSFAALC